MTKFGADWLIFVHAKVLTRKLWTYRRTVSDHNSSLSTLCSGEVKIQAIVSENKFFKEKVYKCTHACTWLPLYKSIINRIIKEICIHKSNLPKF